MLANLTTTVVITRRRPSKTTSGHQIKLQQTWAWLLSFLRSCTSFSRLIKYRKSVKMLSRPAGAVRGYNDFNKSEGKHRDRFYDFLLRFITDFRQQNANTIRDSYPIHHQPTIINKMISSKYFQVRIAPEHIRGQEPRVALLRAI